MDGKADIFSEFYVIQFSCRLKRLKISLSVESSKLMWNYLTKIVVAKPTLYFGFLQVVTKI